MSTDRKITLFYAPHTRAGATLQLLEELGAPYELRLIDFKAGEHRQPPFLAINPMGKLPTIRHGDAIVTEQVAIFLYLADLFPESQLAPALGDPLRGPYLRWMVFYAASFEPAMVDKSMGRDGGPPSRSPYGDYDTVLKTVLDQLGRRPYMLGERMTAADILWGSALTFMTMFKMMPETPVVTAYVQRMGARPSVARARAKDAAILAGQA